MQQGDVSVQPDCCRSTRNGKDRRVRRAESTRAMGQGTWRMSLRAGDRSALSPALLHRPRPPVLLPQSRWAPAPGQEHSPGNSEGLELPQHVPPARSGQFPVPITIPQLGKVRLAANGISQTGSAPARGSTAAFNHPGSLTAAHSSKLLEFSSQDAHKLHFHS